MGVVLAGAEPLLMLGEREQGSQSERAVRLLGLRRTGPAQAKSLLLSYTKAGASLVLIETAAEDERELSAGTRSAPASLLLASTSSTLGARSCWSSDSAVLEGTGEVPGSTAM